jgi:hypothetical protein
VRKTHILVRVVLGVSGILTVLNADEVRVNGGGIETQTDKGVDGGGLVDAGEGPRSIRCGTE